MNADLIDRGLRLRDLGKTLAWSDLRDIVNWRRHDSALSRAVDPDGWWWDDPAVQLAAESASTLSSMRFWDLMFARVFEEIPDEYLPRKYGRRTEAAADGEGEVEQARAAEQEARDVAASLR